MREGNIECSGFDCYKNMNPNPVQAENTNAERSMQFAHKLVF
jgi:hypothetical protein